MGVMWWSAVAFYAALDAIVAVFVACFAPDGQRIVAFVAMMAIFWLLPAVIGLWEVLKFWAGHHLYLKRRMVRIYKARLQANEFPPTDGFHDATCYLSFIMDNDGDLGKRLKAAATIGEFQACRPTRPLTLGAASENAFQQAMQEYKPD